jgi:type IV pilus assembly protein PilV
MTDNFGFTLIEFLLAVVILSVGMLGMLQGINIAMDKNRDNVFRTEAVMLADERMMAVRALAFDSLSATVAAPPKESAGSRSFKSYSVQKIVTQVTGKSKEVVINVYWHKKKTSYSHSISSVLTTSQ